MKKILKGILIGLLIALILIQFVRPKKNVGSTVAATDILHVVQMPDTIKKMFELSCYDCHSNNTDYPWYSQIAPFSWWLDNHIKEGKKELNFTEFARLAPRRMLSKLSAIAEQVEKKEMPLNSYLLIHTNAKLNDGQIQLIKSWADSAKQQLRSNSQ